MRRTEAELGPLDLLVNNAGTESASGPLWEQDPTDWWRVFEVNVRGPMLCCRAVLPGMVERGRGRIVNVGSGGSYLPVRAGSIALGTAYGPSKAALGRFSELLAAQVGGLGVHVFLISPGLVRTALTGHSATTPVDAARARSPARARPRFRSRRRARRPLPPRGARRRRAARPSRGRDRRAGPERHPAPPVMWTLAPSSS